MKILLIVYAVSWLILLAIYISANFRSNTVVKECKSWKFYLFLVILSPLILPVALFVIIREYKAVCGNKKKNKEVEKRKNNQTQQIKEVAENKKMVTFQRYTVAFKDLPFSPEMDQVIYVENAYDKKVNSYIKKNYYKLTSQFKKKKLDFVYLPLYFNAELDIKVHYYAPYVTKYKRLPSNYMLNYMLRQENKKCITPSLLFSPKQRADEWVFNAIYIDNINVEVSDIVQNVEDAIVSLKQFERAEFQIVRPTKYETDETSYYAVGNPSTQEVKEPPIQYGSVDNDSTSLQRTIFKPSEHIRFRITRNEDDDDDDVLFRSADEKEESDEQEIDVEIGEIYAKIQGYVKLLRLKGIELAAIREFIDEQEPLSPLVITEDLRLFLPLYNIEIELSAQKKALYFLFLNHPEGIVLQHLEEYHNELVNYYKQTNNGILTQKMEDSIRKLETYGNNQLHVVIARIREAFCTKFDERLARNYFICGEKGRPYHISLDKELIKWED